MNNHQAFIQRCFELAKLAEEQGDTPVGSLIVIRAEIISEGIEAVKSGNDLTAHAEVVAIQEACRKLGARSLKGATLYTSVEPCWMCSYLIRQTRIARVVVSKPNSKTGGISSSHPVLTTGVNGLSDPPEIIWL